MQFLSPFHGQLVSSPVAVQLALDTPHPIGVGKHHLRRDKDGVASYVYSLTDHPKFEPGPHTLTYTLVDAWHRPVAGVAPATVTFTVGSLEPPVEGQIRKSLKAPLPYGLGWTDAMVDRVLQ